MFQEHWEGQLTSSSDKGRIAPHVNSLVKLLQSHLSHHRFPEATPILETLALATDRVPGIVWRGGREVLLHSGDYSHALQLYRSFFKVQQWRIETLLETSFFTASHGHLDEAYDCLSSQLQVNPFRSHPLCHGYCGLYQFLLHRQHQTSTTTRIKTELRGIHPIAVTAQEEAAEDSTPHITLALKHLQTVQTIDAQLPDGTGNLDLFVKLLAELLEEQGKIEEALACLVRYCHGHPLRLNPTRSHL
ncbi:hypothetical protein GBAR_LOCUS30228 [Geodia barretti]|uniref:Uncharacterized protein n=1 Tax=Geodia barretti TaxID=519541 RepID=A0AA35TYF9_GEOBA|nr:hypothetical protein GBAR_LOCUS30228 [Geodia barretti]